VCPGVWTVCVRYIQYDVQIFSSCSYMLIALHSIMIAKQIWQVCVQRIAETYR